MQTETVEADKMPAVARALIERTGMNLFLTGKAGTGKTTFLRNLREESRKRIVVVAPTGIAAINAGGVTIHSFFQLDFNSVPSDMRRRSFDKFSKAKLNMIRSVDLLVIDEISMVRADLLDRVDEVLRRHRNPRRPFGGVQLLMIGDLHQLPPVVTDDEAEALRERYKSPYFFESEALKRAGFVTLELTKVYRQNDEYFISLLNAIRTNRAGGEVLSALNTCVGKRFDDSKKFVRLVTHNYQARNINEAELGRIPEPAIVFEAEIEGKFPDSSIPGDRSLVLKKGAQVMFIKNDLSNHDWYNGLLAEVIDLSESHIRVMSVDGRELTVRKEEWVNNSYAFDEEKQEIAEVREGAFRQYPLRLAWAITIHKSQGLTFDRAVIDATDAFAHGQTYVALSRCRSLEGLSLERPLTPASVITDRVVQEFLEGSKSDEIDNGYINRLEKEYSLSLLKELFDFNEISSAITDVTRQVGRLPLQYQQLSEEVALRAGTFRNEFIDVAAKLESWFPHLIVGTPGLNAGEKVKAGANYFATRLTPLAELVGRIPVNVENKELRKRLDISVSHLRNLLYVKRGLLQFFAENDFDTDACLRLKSKLQIEAENATRPVSKTKKPAPASAQTAAQAPSTPKGAATASHAAPSAPQTPPARHEDLERMLKGWRARVAKEKGLPAFRIMSNNAIRSVAEGLPQSMAELVALRNIGEYIATQYGTQLLEIVKKWKEKSMR